MVQFHSGLLLFLACGACKSAEEWGENADAEVYDILAERRAEVGASEPFNVMRPTDTLREKLLAAPDQPLELDFVGCLTVAAENSRDWQDERELLFRSALALTLERWNFSVQENGSLAYFVNGQGNDPLNEGFLSNLNLFKLLGIGTAITADVGLDFLRDAASGNGWDALSHLSLNITQPILRGFGRDIVLEPLTQAERDVLYQARDYERFRRTFAVQVAQGFFRTLELVDRLKNEEANYTNLKALRERNEAFAEAGRLTDIQVDQARQDEFTAEDRVVTSRRALETALDNLKFLLGLPIRTELSLVEGDQRSPETWSSITREFQEDLVVQTGLANRLDHRTALDRVEDAERGVRVAADALRMGFDVSASGAAVSDADHPAEFSGDNFIWSVGFDLDLPIDRIPERNAYRTALIQREARARDAEESTDRVTSELRDALRSLDAARESYQIQSGSVVLAERRVESAALNLEAGRASTRDVLEAQESLLQAQNDLVGALTDTILAGLSLYRDMERLEVTPQGIEVLTDVPPGEPQP